MPKTAIRLAIKIAIAAGFAAALLAAPYCASKETANQKKDAPRAEFEAVSMQTADVSAKTEPEAPNLKEPAEAKKYLAGLATAAEFKVLQEIIQCESGWQHYWPTTRAGHKAGDVKISNGNIGFGQLNRPTWEKWMQKNHGLDIYDPADNLKATLLIYRRSGIGPWEPYSGHCFKPKLQAKGISPR